MKTKKGYIYYYTEVQFGKQYSEANMVVEVIRVLALYELLVARHCSFVL